MDFSLTDEQKQLKDSLRRFLDKDYAFEARRSLVEKGSGFGRYTWKTIADLGLLALAVPEAQGGLAGTAVDTALVMEEFGRSLVVEPYAAVAVLATHAIAAAATDAQKDEWLPALAAGDAVIVLAHEEPAARGRLEHVTTRARRAPDGSYMIEGHKVLVQGAPVADRILVSARLSGAADDETGLGLFMVERDARGLTRQDVRLLDGSPASDLRLDGVKVAPEAALGEPGKAFPAIASAVEQMIVALCAEAVGAMDRTIWITRDYLKTRKQFGVTLNTFQALQHRMADMVIEHEMARSMLLRALGALQESNPVTRSLGVSAAKAQVLRAARFVCAQGIQLHGGMGMTEEYVIGHYFKRINVIDALFGNIDHHVRRYAGALQTGHAA